MNKVKLHKHLQTKAKETYKHSYARQYNIQTKRSKQKKRVIPMHIAHVMPQNYRHRKVDNNLGERNNRRLTTSYDMVE